MPLHGHRDTGPLDPSTVPADNDGNLRALLRMRSCCDKILEGHLESNRSSTSYLSPTVQHEIVKNYGDLIKENVVSRVNAACCFSVLADETADIAGIERLTICSRYLNKKSNDCEEAFLGFVPILDQSGRNIAKTIIHFLINLEISMEHVRCQGYHGARLVPVKRKGVQASIRETYPAALYMNYASHSLNLVFFAA